MLADANPTDIIERQRAPHDLTDEECEVWVGIVAAETADWFTVSTRPILAQYCRHVVQARRIGELIERATSDKNLSIQDYNLLLKMQERESRTMATLGTKLRINQQTTHNHRGNRHKTLAQKPWES